METNRNPKNNKVINPSDIDSVIRIAEEASGFSREEILSNQRRRPLPAIRWLIGDTLVNLGYSCNKASKIVNLTHATLLHGRKAIEDITARAGWKEEVDILIKFRELCKLKGKTTTPKSM